MYTYIILASYPVSTASFFLHVGNKSGKKKLAVETGYEAIFILLYHNQELNYEHHVLP